VSIFHQQKAASILYVFEDRNVPATYVFSRARWPAGSSQKFVPRRARHIARALNNAPRASNEELIGAYCGTSRFNHPFDHEPRRSTEWTFPRQISVPRVLVFRDSVFLTALPLETGFLAGRVIMAICVTDACNIRSGDTRICLSIKSI